MVAVRSASMVPIKTIVIQVVLVALSVLFVLPLVWMLSTFLKPIQETLTTPPRWIPSSLQWHNYPDAILYGRKELGYIPLLVYARNTLVIAVLSVIGAVTSNSLVAYSFARLRWPGKDPFFVITLRSSMKNAELVRLILAVNREQIGQAGCL